MDEAMHPLTILAVGLYGEVLPNQNGAPLRLVVPWKYGFKSIKSIVEIRFTERQPPTTWNLSAPQEYGFFANVNPDVDHPRWSQARERRIGSGVFAPRGRRCRSTATPSRSRGCTGAWTWRRTSERSHAGPGAPLAKPALFCCLRAAARLAAGARLRRRRARARRQPDRRTHGPARRLGPAPAARDAVRHAAGGHAAQAVAHAPAAHARPVRVHLPLPALPHLAGARPVVRPAAPSPPTSPSGRTSPWDSPPSCCSCRSPSPPPPAGCAGSGRAGTGCTGWSTRPRSSAARISGGR